MQSFYIKIVPGFEAPITILSSVYVCQDGTYYKNFDIQMQFYNNKLILRTKEGYMLPKGKRTYILQKIFKHDTTSTENLSTKMLLYGPRQANLVLIAYGSSECSGEPAHPRSLARTFAARSYKQWIKRNLQTESQIPGPSEWLGMRSWNLSWRNARRHKFAWRGSYSVIVKDDKLQCNNHRLLVFCVCFKDRFPHVEEFIVKSDATSKQWWMSGRRRLWWSMWFFSKINFC